MEQVSLPLWVDEAWSCRHIAPNRRGLAFRASYLDESRSTEYLPNLYLCRDIVPCHFSCRRNRYSNEDIFFCGIAIFASYLQCYQWLHCTLSQHNRLSPEPAKDANLCHSDASYKYKNCACAGVLSLFLQSYGRVRILPYEAETRTAQRCQAARLRATGTGQWHQGVRRLLLSSCYMVHGVSVHVRAIASCSGTADRRPPSATACVLRVTGCLQGQDVTKTIQHTVGWWHGKSSYRKVVF